MIAAATGMSKISRCTGGGGSSSSSSSSSRFLLSGALQLRTEDGRAAGEAADDGELHVPPLAPRRCSPARTATAVRMMAAMVRGGGGERGDEEGGEGGGKVHNRWKAVETRGDFCGYASRWRERRMSDQEEKGARRSLLRIKGGAKKTRRSRKSDQDKIAKWYKKFPLGMALFDAAGQFQSHLPNVSKPPTTASVLRARIWCCFASASFLPFFYLSFVLSFIPPFSLPLSLSLSLNTHPEL
jgi:hypothetical protein